MHAYIVVSLMTGVRPEEAGAIESEEEVDLDGTPLSVTVSRADRAGGDMKTACADVDYFERPDGPRDGGRVGLRVHRLVGRHERSQPLRISGPRSAGMGTVRQATPS